MQSRKMQKVKEVKRSEKYRTGKRCTIFSHYVIHYRLVSFTNSYTKIIVVG